jgi:two-component system, response regulator
MQHDYCEILLVEDNPDDEELALIALEESGVTSNIKVVRDGKAAVDYIFCEGPYAHRRIEDHPRLIMLDLKLPLLSGIEVLRRVKTDPRTRKIPVAVLTSSKENPDIDTCYDLGVNSYIVKPVDHDQFMQVVKELELYWLVRNQPPN